MLLVERDHEIHTLAANRADHAFNRHRHGRTRLALRYTVFGDAVRLK
jgi:hypothetical protein